MMVAAEERKSNDCKSCSTPEPFSRAMDRETRLVEAQTALAVVMAVISPPQCSEDDDPTEDITFDVRFGLANLLRQVNGALEESLEAFCCCYEESGKDLALTTKTTEAMQ